MKAKYFNTIDRKLWIELADCFSEDGDHMINTHQGHNPEIEITSNTTAKGIWNLYHYRDDIKEKIRKQNAVFYEDDYVKEKGTWRIKHTKILPIYLNESRIEE